MFTDLNSKTRSNIASLRTFIFVTNYVH